MNYGEIKNCDIANGEGVRVSLFVSGCTHHCKNCFNAETWDFDFGEPFTREIEDKIIELHKQKQDLAVRLLDGSDMAGAISADELLKVLQNT